MNNRLSRFPASWIPTLYIAEGLPYFAVNVLAVILYTRMGGRLKGNDILHRLPIFAMGD